MQVQNVLSNVLSACLLQSEARYPTGFKGMLQGKTPKRREHVQEHRQAVTSDRRWTDSQC